MENFVVLIPAYNPDRKLSTLVNALHERHQHIIVVNDGSCANCNNIFQDIASLEKAEVLHHAVNLGKGAALKTGLNHIAVTFPNSSGVVCADADGQHAVKDILVVGEKLAKKKNALGLGVRKFHRDIPWRSRFGNQLTKKILKFLTGLDVADTQTGLRAIPMALIPHILPIRSNRYEFELEMLLMAKRKHFEIVQTPIETIYIENNKSSHFSVLKDSARIYFVLFRFIFSSLLAAMMDYMIFMGIYTISKNILLSQYVARIGSGTINYSLNRKLVFASRSGLIVSLSKYASLAIGLAFCSYVLIRYLEWIGLPVAFAKPLAEGGLFVASFSIQRNFVFNTDYSEYTDLDDTKL